MSEPFQFSQTTYKDAHKDCRGRFCQKVPAGPEMIVLLFHQLAALSGSSTTHSNSDSVL